MRYHILLVSLFAFAEFAGTAGATTRPDPAEPPTFTSGEVRVINRNALLSTILHKDPWLVRHILDLTAPGEGGAASRMIKAVGINVKANPDLAPARRDATGAVEWIELLKRAKVEKDGVKPTEPAREVVPDTRTSEGSLELIDMAKKARDAKRRHIPQ